MSELLTLLKSRVSWHRCLQLTWDSCSQFETPLAKKHPSKIHPHAKVREIHTNDKMSRTKLLHRNLSPPPYRAPYFPDTSVVAFTLQCLKFDVIVISLLVNTPVPQRSQWKAGARLCLPHFTQGLTRNRPSNKECVGPLLSFIHPITQSIIREEMD